VRLCAVPGRYLHGGLRGAHRGTPGRLLRPRRPVTRDTRWSQLVTIDIVRHDPLTTGKTIPSQVLTHRPPPWPGIAGKEAS